MHIVIYLSSLLVKKRILRLMTSVIFPVLDILGFLDKSRFINFNTRHDMSIYVSSFTYVSYAIGLHDLTYVCIFGQFMLHL